MFKEKIKNWKYGPVIPEAYNDFKACGKRTIELSDYDLKDEFDSLSIANDKVMNEFLTDIFEHFDQYSAIDLYKKTHQEDPWKSTKQDEEITHKKMKDFFNNVFDEEEGGSKFEYIRDFEDRKLSRICKETLENIKNGKEELVEFKI